jgi:NitT/TauT family transport system substrate-binding protein
MKDSALGYRVVSVIMGALMSSAIVAGCSSTPKEPIRIGLNPWPGYAFLHLAAEKGFFADEKVDVRLIELSSLADVRRAFERGLIDAMGCSLIEVMQVTAQSKEQAQVFYVTDFSAGADVILARAPIATVASLRGKRIGVELGSLTVFLLSRALERSGMTLADVQLVPLGQMNMVEEFEKGAIDAAVTYPPISVTLQNRDDTNAIFSSEDIPREIADVIAVKMSVMRTREGDIVAIIRAVERAMQFAEDHPDEAYAIMARHERLSPEEFATILRDEMNVVRLIEQPAFFESDGVLAASVGHLNSMFLQLGEFEQPVPAEDVIADRPMRKALRRE